MSLISEGLKKAHLETLRQDRESRRHYLGPGRTDVPPRTASWTATLGMAALGGAIVAGGVAVYLGPAAGRSIDVPGSLASPNSAPAAAEMNVAPARSPEASPAAASPAAEETALPAVHQPTVKTTVPEPKRADQVPAKALRVEGTKTVASVAAVEGPAVARQEKPEPPAVRRRDSFEDGKTYMTPIRAPAGGEVALSGVSSLRGQVVALMNGVIVREGSTVGPFVVERIERERVQLRYIDVRFWVTY